MNTIVIGAGLAGAAVAHALAQRGCNVTVLEASAAPTHTSTATAPSSSPAAPSRGLPAALMAPHYPAEAHAPSALTQLSRLGVAATSQAARALLVEGQDWQACGALQRAGKLGPLAHWFAEAAWVKPAALVAAWLAHPRISVRGGAAVHRLQRGLGTAGGWQAFCAQGKLLATADTAVLANAYQAQALLQRLSDEQGGSLALQRAAAALHTVAGQVIYGPWTAQWQALWPVLLPELAAHRTSGHLALQTHTTEFCAVNGNGHFIPAIACSAGHRQGSSGLWLSGSTYEHGTPQPPQVTAQGIAANLQRLQQLLPAAASLLAQQHSAGQLQGWAGARCTTRDRLPMVGALSPTQAPGLYVCTAMGSRGLSFAALCGQLTACIVSAQTGTLPEALARAIAPDRF